MPDTDSCNWPSVTSVKHLILKEYINKITRAWGPKLELMSSYQVRTLLCLTLCCSSKPIQRKVNKTKKYSEDSEKSKSKISENGWMKSTK